MHIPIKKLNDDTRIPMIGVGTWKLTGEMCTRAIKKALEIGYRHIDTAHVYENHVAIKEGIQGFNRDELFITSKLWKDHHDPKLVQKMCEQALTELGLDHLDLYLLHWPLHQKNLPDVVHEMHLLKEQGKIRSVGISNATIHHIQDLYNQKLDVSVNQVEVHPFHMQTELVRFCLMHNIAITAYCPLARGEVFHDETLNKLGQKYGKTSGQVALRFLVHKDLIVIPKSSSEPHLRENFEIFDFKLTNDEIQAIDQLNEDKRLVLPEYNEFDY